MDQKCFELGELITIRAWPNNSVYLPRKFINQYDSIASVWESYGYRRAEDYFDVTESGLIKIALEAGSGPLTGLIVSTKSFTNETKNRFYEVLLQKSIRPLWFPEADVLKVEKKKNCCGSDSDE